ncbi:hypothetical protein [Streptomyces sp. NPDC000888]
MDHPATLPDDGGTHVDRGDVHMPVLGILLLLAGSAVATAAVFGVAQAVPLEKRKARPTTTRWDSCTRRSG